MEEKAGRTAWVDAAKGLGIILVVVSHDFRGLEKSEIITDTGGSFGAIDAWIYAFHMPLFFFLSGLFLSHSVGAPFWEFWINKLRTIAYPYFLWSCLTVLLKSSIGKLPNTPRTLQDLPLIFYHPLDHYWFLYCLFLLLISFGAALYLKLPIWMLALSSVLLWMFPPHGWPVLHLTATYAIFVGAGLAAARTVNVDQEFPRVPLVLLCVLGLAVSFLPKLQPSAAFGGICFCIAAAQLSRHPLSTVLGILGTYSLEIYLLHPVISAACRIALIGAGLRAPSVHLLLGCGSGILVPLCIGIACRRYFPYAFVLQRKRPSGNLVARSN